MAWTWHWYGLLYIYVHVFLNYLYNVLVVLLTVPSHLMLSCLFLVSQRQFSTTVDIKVLFYSILFHSILFYLWSNSNKWVTYSYTRWQEVCGVIELHVEKHELLSTFSAIIDTFHLSLSFILFLLAKKKSNSAPLSGHGNWENLKIQHERSGFQSVFHGYISVTLSSRTYILYYK